MNPWCQEVLDFTLDDLLLAEQIFHLFPWIALEIGTLLTFPVLFPKFQFFIHGLDLFLSSREEISGHLSIFIEYSRYSTQAKLPKLTQRQRMNFSTQAKLEQQV